MRKNGTLDWRPIPGRQNKRDCYADDGKGSRWTVKLAALSYSTFYVLRLNGDVMARVELFREAQRRAEQLTAEREIVR